MTYYIVWNRKPGRHFSNLSQIAKGRLGLKVSNKASFRLSTVYSLYSNTLLLCYIWFLPCWFWQKSSLRCMLLGPNSPNAHKSQFYRGKIIPKTNWHPIDSPKQQTKKFVFWPWQSKNTWNLKFCVQVSSISGL